MIDWQNILSLFIVAAASIQLVRLLIGKKSKCGNCNHTCPTQQNHDNPLVQLDDLTSRK